MEEIGVPLSSLDSKYAFRAEMVDRLVEDLFGPTSDEELLTERPLERYVTGVLWPASDETLDAAPDEPDSAAAEAGDSAVDSPVANSRLTYPTSLGVTVSVDTAATHVIRIIPSGAQYTPVATTNTDSRRRENAYDWRRAAIDSTPIDVDVTAVGRHAPKLLEDGGLELYVLVREPEGETTTVTVALRNRRTKSTGEDRDRACWFQVGLAVEADAMALTDRSKLRSDVSDDADLASSELLYRKSMVFGAGHGCAVEWADIDVEGPVCRKVSTTFIPRQDVHRSVAGGTDADLSLDLLSTGNKERVLSELETLHSDYLGWISLTGEIAAGLGPDSVPSHLEPVSRRHLNSAGEAADRIRAGIQVLRDDKQAFEAFQLANQAMHMQRSRQDWIRAGGTGEFMLGSQQSWRPFQIAFILLNLPSVTDHNHPERDFADLLWFPTGGGKTEAYLGLIAYLILLRRLRDPEAKGVAVIMRYTLRLLTIQQFERAAMLICSLESVRKKDPERLGLDAFSIGLWVGSAATPNDIKDARTNLGKLRRGDEVVEGNPCQIEACPWCGRRLKADDYRIDKVPTERMGVRCSNGSCDYKDGLPVHIVDTDVYRERPELVIGTVDKFARMAWKGEVASLFGRKSPSDYGPDLIIQDELHLISGPLGSTVGIFETAVDLASGGLGRGTDNHCEDPRRPKIIASTATIRRADTQIKSVFNRESRLFPPPGIDPDDSFFAKKAPANQLGTRQYVGLMAAGTSHATLMVRTYASLLNSAAVVDASSKDDRDPYWTLIGYFNSLRVLGSAYLQVYDDVRARLKLLASREGISDARQVELSELTSRVSSDRIPYALKSLENSLGGQLTPNDVVLATNMISVGLDVDRLGLMAVMGQPQSSAEYIQATSRVGRQHPGLVVTIFNAAKSRDRSHFEGFVPFHQALYRAVEATSATPFAARSRDRALHAVMISALRMIESTVRYDDQARNVTDAGASIELVLRHIRERVAAIDGNEVNATINELEILLKAWRLEAQTNSKLQYWKMRDPVNSLLIDFAKALEDPNFVYTTTKTPWPTPSSMRDVDAETTLRPIRVREDANNG
jgi:hypothetical protein